MGNSKDKAVFTGWSCLAGPAIFVDWLVERGTQVDFKEFTSNVETSEIQNAIQDSFGGKKFSKSFLEKDWGITWLKTELIDGSSAWVMQHSGIEFLFLPKNTSDYSDYMETILAVEDIQKYIDTNDIDVGWPNEWTDELILTVTGIDRKRTSRNPENKTAYMVAMPTVEGSDAFKKCVYAGIDVLVGAALEDAKFILNYLRRITEHRTKTAVEFGQYAMTMNAHSACLHSPEWCAGILANRAYKLYLYDDAVYMGYSEEDAVVEATGAVASMKCQRYQEDVLERVESMREDSRG